MRTGSVVFGVAICSAMLFASQTLLSQQAGVTLQPCDEGLVQLDGSTRNSAMVCKGHPYTAIRKETHIQKREDGSTVISHENTTTQARDSMGRTYSETRSVSRVGETPAQTLYSFSDPEKRVTINWKSGTDEAVVLHLPDAEQIKKLWPSTWMGCQMIFDPKPDDPESEIEDLGKKKIQGLEVRGTRCRFTYAANSAKDSERTVVTTESWYSPVLNTSVYFTDDEPNGFHKTEMVDFKGGEPDPALFQMPKGRTVKDVYWDQH